MTKCHFEMDGRCKILDVGKCPAGCKFRKTHEEYNDGLRKAEEMLRKRGLKAVIKNNTVTTRRI